MSLYSPPLYECGNVPLRGGLGCPDHFLSLDVLALYLLLPLLLLLSPPLVGVARHGNDGVGMLFMICLMVWMSGN